MANKELWEPDTWPAEARGVGMTEARTLQVHEDLSSCKVCWGNSATMAAEAAMMGIPSVFVGAEIFSYLLDLEKAGLVFCFDPDQLEKSMKTANELLSEDKSSKYLRLRDALVQDCQDVLDVIFHKINIGC